MSKTALLQFINAKGAGDATIRRLAAFTAREKISPDDVVAMRPDEIAAAVDTTPDVANAIIAAKEPAIRLAEELESLAISLVWLNDPNYPSRLKAILGRDAPSVLFMKGNAGLLKDPAVGFCGSRKASEKGLDVTNRAAKGLARERVCVVSGYAHGVDLAAHRGAMEVGGTTILVLVDGILRFQVKKEIADAITPDNHLVISQFPPNLTWIGRNAMKRNGTIIGLSDAMILVESGREGGTFAAGTETLKRKHPLFVIDFAEPGPSAEANPYFIERGGIPIRGNRQHEPNLERVLEMTRNPRWREQQSDQPLFE
jgi:DNA processing protein